ncbi:MAG: helix-turn-helix domain-containing protein [Chthoniobacterales bacterium]|nr:helix-turn-helix domain-containing protein [Chthoniobacterales bacterium]
MSPKTVGLLGFDGVTASHLTGPADVLAVAALQDGFGGRIPCYQVWTIGLTTRSFIAESGAIFHPQMSLSDAPALDTIIVAGGCGSREVSEALSEWILGRVFETGRIASIGSGIFALAPTGLLDGREVTTHWRCTRELERRYPTLRVNHKRSLIKDGPFFTSAGLTGGVDLALAMIEEDYGEQVALAARQELMLRLGDSHSPNEKVATRGEESRPIDRFGELVAWIMQNLDQNLTVEVLARQAGICPSHFTRAFKSVFGNTPGEFVETLRLNEARRRLSSRGKTLRSVAASVGFTDATAFRRAFERRFGAGPNTYLKSREGVLTLTPDLAYPAKG